MQKLQGFVEAGNTTLAITGAAGTIARKVQGSFPSATITVYAAGTVTLSTIYSDNSSTAKANPFTAAADGTWFFYAANGRYDVRFSGGSITTPFTVGDFELFDGQVGVGSADYFVTEMAEDFVSVRRYGALIDGRRVLDAAMTSGVATLSSATAAFTSADVGKLVAVEGAGASSGTLLATISSIGGATSATLSVAASTTVSNVQAIFASNDTTAIQAALDANPKVYIPAGVCGISRLRLALGNQLCGAGPSKTQIARLAAGSGGPTIAMTAGQAAQGLLLQDFCLHNCHAVDDDGIDLGTEGASYRYANDSYINNVRVMSTSRIAFDLSCNVGEVGQVWAQNFPGQGTPNALSIANSVGFKSADTMLIAPEVISVEGHFEANLCDFGAGDSEINCVQLEPTHTAAAVDLITMNATFQTIKRVFAVQWSGTACTRRDLVRIASGVQAIRLGQLVNNSSFPITLTNMVNDVTNSQTLAADSNHWTVEEYYNDQRNSYFWNDSYKIRLGKRLSWGASSVTAANDITLGYVANAYSVTGSTQINRILTTDWPAGSELTLLFTGAPLITHNAAAGSGYAGLYLQGEVNWQTSDNDSLTLLYNGTAWYETARSVNGAYFTTFTPTYSSSAGNAATTFTGPGTVTTTVMRYTKIGNLVVLTATFNATLNAVTPNAIYFTVPTGIRPANDSTYSSCSVLNDTTYETGIVRTRNDLTAIEVNRANNANWGSGVAIACRLSFSYEATG